VNNLERGIVAENLIVEKIHFRNKDLELEQNHTWGIDIILNNKNKKKVKIEVKSCQRFVKNKCGKEGIRLGKFSIQLTDLERDIDYFAFVINKANGKVNTYWVKGDIIRKHFSTRKQNKKLGFGISTLLNHTPKVDFSEVIDL